MRKCTQVRIGTCAAPRLEVVHTRFFPSPSHIFCTKGPSALLTILLGAWLLSIVAPFLLSCPSSKGHPSVSIRCAWLLPSAIL